MHEMISCRLHTLRAQMLARGLAHAGGVHAAIDANVRKQCTACNSVLYACRYGDNAVGPIRTLPVMSSFTFLRLIPDMMSPEYQSIWFRFMRRMQETQATE